MTNADNKLAARKRGRRSRRRLRSVDPERAAGFAIVLLWIFSNLWDIFSETYSPPEGLHAVGLAAASYLFIKKSNGGDK